MSYDVIGKHVVNCGLITSSICIKHADEAVSFVRMVSTVRAVVECCS